jgi:hypothetical protein
LNDHRSLGEGARLGLLVATSIWIWLALVDAVVGQPFHTFRVLGGVVTFTTLHYALNVAYGVAIVALIHASAREPRVLIAALLGFFVVEFAFVMLTVLLSHTGLGRLAWVRVLGGNLIGAVVGGALLLRTHPLRAELRQADAEESD